MQPKVIITCAVTGAGDTVGKHPAIPVTPEQIANAALEAASAEGEDAPADGEAPPADDAMVDAAPADETK